MPIDISNVLPIDPKTSQPTRVGFRITAEGNKERYAKKSGETLGVLYEKNKLRSSKSKGTA